MVMFEAIVTIYISDRDCSFGNENHFDAWLIRFVRLAQESFVMNVLFVRFGRRFRPCEECYLETVLFNFVP